MWEKLWVDTLRKAPADRYAKGVVGADGKSRDRWRDLVERIATDAALLEPPMEPAAHAEELMRALLAYREHAARTGEEVPSVSVAAFEGWYAKLAEWVARRRPKARRELAAAPAATAATPVAPPAPVRELSPEEAEREAAEARDAMDQLFGRGKYAPGAAQAQAEGEPVAEAPPEF